jgi:VanZ family protein
MQQRSVSQVSNAVSNSIFTLPARFRPRSILLWAGPLLLWGGVVLWSGAEWTRYETTWKWLQWILRVLCPEHAPPEGTDLQVNISMYQLNGAVRRFAHVVVYAVAAALTVRAIQRGETRLKPLSLVAAIGLGLVYTLIDEGNRLFFQQNRHAKWTDLYLNLFGVGLTVGGTVLYFAFKNWEAKIVAEEAAARVPGSVAEVLARVDTRQLEREGTLTRALIVFNAGPEAVTAGRTIYRADFPIRRAVGTQPVTVYDGAGKIVPSRLLVSELIDDPNLPADRARWRLELELVVSLPGRHGRAYGAVFARSPESRSEDTAYWDALPAISR